MAFNVERKALERDVTSALLLNGYSQVKRDKFLKRIGQETDVFVYPGVGSKSTILELQPVVGFENVTLRSRLQAVGKKDADNRSDDRAFHDRDGSDHLPAVRCL